MKESIEPFSSYRWAKSFLQLSKRVLQYIFKFFNNWLPRTHALDPCFDESERGFENHRD